MVENGHLVLLHHRWPFRVILDKSDTELFCLAKLVFVFDPVHHEVSIEDMNLRLWILLLDQDGILDTDRTAYTGAISSLRASCANALDYYHIVRIDLAGLESLLQFPLGNHLVAIILIHTLWHEVPRASGYNDHTQPDIFARAIGAKGYIKLADKTFYLFNGGACVYLNIGVIFGLFDLGVYDLRCVQIHWSEPVQRAEHASQLFFLF